MALLGKYYAAKIRGATELALFRADARARIRRRPSMHLHVARQAGRKYTERASAQYRNPLWTNRVGLVDWD